MTDLNSRLRLGAGATLAVAVMAVLLLAACERVPDPTSTAPVVVDEIGEPTVQPTAGSTPEPTAVPTPTPIPTPTPYPRDSRIENLPWVADGIDGDVETDAYDNLYGLAGSYSGLLDTLVAKIWVDADDIESGDPTAASMIELAVQQVRADTELTGEIYKYSFLDSLHPADDVLVNSFIRINDADSEAFTSLLARPAFQGDIDDDSAAISDVLVHYLALRLTDDSFVQLNLPWLVDERRSAADAFRIAIASPETMSALLGHFGSDAIHGELLRHFADLAEINDRLSVRLVVMPFLESFDVIDVDIVEALSKVATANPDGLSEFLTLYELRGGVVNTDVYGAKIAAVEGGIGEIGAALNEMPWYVDGIDIRPGNAPAGLRDDNGPPLYWSYYVPRREILESEDRIMARIVETVEDGHVETVVALTDRDWMHSSVDALEFEVISQILAIAPNYDLPHPGIVGMPFLDSIEEYDIVALSALEELSGVDPDHETVVASGPFDGGITDSSAPLLQFAILQSLSPEAANSIGPTLENEDALSPTEHYAVRILSRLAKDNEALLDAILEKSWARDGFTVDETDFALELLRLDFYLAGESDYPITLLEMPFLEVVDPFDKKAVEALNELHWLSSIRAIGVQNLRSYVADHQAFADGIRDSDVLKLSVLDDFANGIRRSDHAYFDPDAYIEGLDDILLPGAMQIEEGTFPLPNGQHATVRVFRPEAVSLVPRTMPDLLAQLEFQLELFNPTPDETDYSAIAIAGWGDAHARGEPLSEDRAVFRTGWNSLERKVVTAILEPLDEVWLRESFRRFGMYSHGNDGNPLTSTDSISEIGNCNRYGSILEALEEAQQRGRNCYLDAGPPLIANLENSLTRDAFREGIRGAYAVAREESYRGYASCLRGSQGICQLWEGFVTRATPENAAIAAPLINKWYFGFEEGFMQE